MMLLLLSVLVLPILVSFIHVIIHVIIIIPIRVKIVLIVIVLVIRRTAHRLLPGLLFGILLLDALPLVSLPSGFFFLCGFLLLPLLPCLFLLSFESVEFALPFLLLYDDSRS